MEKLIQLQGIDTKLRDLNDLLGDLPSKVELLNQQEETKNNSLSESKKRLKNLEVETKKREREIAQIDDKISTIIIDVFCHLFFLFYFFYLLLYIYTFY